MTASSFVDEYAAVRMLAAAGLAPPRHGMSGGNPPFQRGEPVVVKGLGENLWHKSELGAVRFMDFDSDAVAQAAEAMKVNVEQAGHRWLGALVCERIETARCAGLPSEALVSLVRTEAGWVILFGGGGLPAEALAAVAPPLRWPVALLPPEAALPELEAHLIGKVWLGTLRGTFPLTGRAQLLPFLVALWRLADLAEAEGLSLLEMNPVALDNCGVPRPLDAVGRREPRLPPRLPPPEGFLGALLAPGKIAVAGVSAQAGGVGRTILENLRRSPALSGGLAVIKPGPERFLELPCRPGIAALRDEPVDLLILAVPAPAAAQIVGELLAQGGGARVVALVAGGLGDGADAVGLGGKMAAQLHGARAAGRWTPAILGPNFLGHWVAETGINSTFIPVEKLAPPTGGGPVALLSQSGAFMLSRWSRNPELRLGLGVALGNQLDAALPDFLAALCERPGFRAVACYVEGFGPGQLAATVKAAARLRERGVTVLMHRAGRSAAGRAAAAAHTGALAGDLVLEKTLLERVGVRFSDSIAAFDAALTWLGICPELQAGPVALLSNAGFESVNGGDLTGMKLVSANLTAADERALKELLQAEALAGLVAPCLPLDLTPMAKASAFAGAVRVLLQTNATALVTGLVPFTRNLDSAAAGAEEFGRTLAGLARDYRKPVGVVVDAGPAYEAYRGILAKAGLPVFSRFEDALAGLRTLA